MGVECPVCGVRFGDERVVACEQCRTPHHAECFAYNGRCAVFGCRGRRGLEQDGVAGASSTELLVIDEEPQDRLPERLFYPVPADAPVRWLAAALACAIAAVVVVAAVVRGSAVVAAGVTFATLWVARAVRRGRFVEPARVGKSWEIDRAAGELAVLTRVPGTVHRETLAGLREIERVVVFREDVQSVQEGALHRYRSSWTILLKLPDRNVPLLVPQWTDGHLTPPKDLERAARKLARSLERELIVDPPPEGKLPPGLGRLPSQGG